MSGTPQSIRQQQPHSDAPRIGVAVTAYNESARDNFAWIRKGLAQALLSQHVSDVVVVNDATLDFPQLLDALNADFGDRVRVVQNAVNLGVFGNKLTALSACHEQWCLIADSDNVFRPDYFQRLVDVDAEQPWDPVVAYSASFGRTEFDYRPFAGNWLAGDIGRMVSQQCGWCLANTGNWFVHRETFLQPFADIRRVRFDLSQPDYFTASTDRYRMHWRLVYDAQDSFFINKTWWLAGGTLRVVDGLEYDHRVDRTRPGNYDRSPPDKEALAPIYALELLDAAKGEHHDYRLLRQNGRYFYLKREDSRVVKADFHTGIFQLCD